jgi:chitodextrinase
MTLHQSLPTLGANNVPQPDTMPPTTPTLLTSNSASSSGTNFTWTASTDNVGTAGYSIYRNDGTTPIATAIYTYFQDSGLQNYTKYDYRVVAFDLGGNQSAPSASASPRRTASRIRPRTSAPLPRRPPR